MTFTLYKMSAPGWKLDFCTEEEAFGLLFIDACQQACYNLVMMKQNWFPTLNAALESEGLLDAWDISFSPIAYGQTFGWTWDDGTRYGHYISVYRNERGLYERPINYSRN